MNGLCLEEAYYFSVDLRGSRLGFHEVGTCFQRMLMQAHSKRFAPIGTVLSVIYDRRRHHPGTCRPVPFDGTRTSLTVGAYGNSRRCIQLVFRHTRTKYI